MTTIMTDPPRIKELVTTMTPAPTRKQANLAASSTAASEPNTDDTQDDDWESDGMSLRKNDPVGECITQLLNEGKVPHFVYRSSKNSMRNNDVALIGFSSPVLSSANYYACKRLASKVFSRSQNNDKTRRSKGDTTSFSWFLLETMAVVYIAVYALNDVTLRFTISSFYIVIVTIVSAIVDVDELLYVVLLVVQKITPNFVQSTILKCACTIPCAYHNLESSLLYGSRFKKRVMPWRDEERIVKFRRKHLNTMKLQTERRRNRRARRKFRIEMRKKEKRGLLLDDYDFDNMHKENIVKVTLDRATEELRRKPPTYFSSRDLCLTSKHDATISDTTRRHFHSLEYCHRIIFQQSAKTTGKGEVSKDRPVSITSSRRMTNSLPLLSPVEAVEVTDQFPDIKVDTGDSFGETYSHCGSVSSSGTQYSLPSQYDFKDDNQYYDYDSDEEESLLEGEDENTSSGEDDEFSQVSDGSGEVVNKMDWITVGTKIGSKILQSRQVHRVISNPSRKLLPEEAKKLMDGIQSVQSEEQLESSLKTSTFDSQYSKTSKTSTEADTMSEATKSTEVIPPQPKRPVHGMWTSAGSASKASSQYGAVTLPVDDLPTRKIFASSTQESVELIRESSDGRNGDKLEAERNATSNGSQFPFQNINSPYNLRQVTSLPSNGSFALKNELTPKASNLVANTNTSPQTNAPSNSFDSTTRLAPMEKGVKIVVPLFAPNVNNRINNKLGGFFQMGTVLSSARIDVTSEKFLSPAKKHKWTLMGGYKDETNCLEVKLVLDKAILRGCRFAEMTIRIMDEWNWVPHFSKYPIGSCVATTFGVGVLVGWRVEDDMHIIRSLWNRSGPGSGLAYLRRECLHSIVEAAVGFDVQTRLGSGFVEGYVGGGKEHTDGKYFVHLKSKGRYQDRVIEFKRSQIISCRVAKFIPVTEHIRAAALYQLEILHYKAILREHMLNDPSTKDRKSGTWRKFSEYVDLFASEFIAYYIGTSVIGSFHRTY